MASSNKKESDSKFIVVDSNGVTTPDSPFPTREAAAAAVVKRLAHDQGVGTKTSYTAVEVGNAG